MIIFPAIDILDQQCVRLTQGDYQQQSVYASDPLKVARTFEQKGAEFLHIVDLNAAKTGEPINNGLVCEIAQTLQIPIQVGGGIRTEEAVRSYLDCGVARVIIGTAAITKEGFLQELCKRYPGKICLSLDVREGEILIKGWTKGSKINLFDYLQTIEDLNLAAIVVTDVAKDGMLQGPSFSIYEEISAQTAHPIIVSGGVSSKEDIEQLRKRNLYGAIVGKALYENKISLEEIL